MKLSQLKEHLSKISTLSFVQHNGSFVPQHFHITEIGSITKHFIDCGGAVHLEKTASLQIWVAEDLEHRLKPSGLLNIIDISKKILDDQDLDVEVEYQTETIGKYDLGFEDENFVLIPKHTDCLAKLNCGIAADKQNIEVTELASTGAACCSPGGGCC